MKNIYKYIVPIIVILVGLWSSRAAAQDPQNYSYNVDIWVEEGTMKWKHKGEEKGTVSLQTNNNDGDDKFIYTYGKDDFIGLAVEGNNYRQNANAGWRLELSTSPDIQVGLYKPYCTVIYHYPTTSPAAGRSSRIAPRGYLYDGQYLTFFSIQEYNTTDENELDTISFYLRDTKNWNIDDEEMFKLRQVDFFNTFAADGTTLITEDDTLFIHRIIVGNGAELITGVPRNYEAKGDDLNDANKIVSDGSVSTSFDGTDLKVDVNNVVETTSSDYIEFIMDTTLRKQEGILKIKYKSNYDFTWDILIKINEEEYREENIFLPPTGDAYFEKYIDLTQHFNYMSHRVQSVKLHSPQALETGTFYLNSFLIGSDASIANEVELSSNDQRVRIFNSQKNIKVSKNILVETIKNSITIEKGGGSFIVVDSEDTEITDDNQIVTKADKLKVTLASNDIIYYGIEVLDAGSETNVSFSETAEEEGFSVAEGVITLPYRTDELELRDALILPYKAQPIIKKGEACYNYINEADTLNIISGDETATEKYTFNVSPPILTSDTSIFVISFSGDRGTITVPFATTRRQLHLYLNIPDTYDINNDGCDDVDFPMGGQVKLFNSAGQSRIFNYEHLVTGDEMIYEPSKGEEHKVEYTIKIIETGEGSQPEFKTYPNPASETLTVEIPHYDYRKGYYNKIKMLTLNGSLLFEKEIANEREYTDDEIIIGEDGEKYVEVDEDELVLLSEVKLPFELDKGIAIDIRTYKAGMYVIVLEGTLKTKQQKIMIVR